MKYSDEQIAIFEFAKNGLPNLIVQAVAGAGKTTTLVECANRMDEDKKILLLAHNRSTRDTLRERIGDKLIICYQYKYCYCRKRYPIYSRG